MENEIRDTEELLCEQSGRTVVRVNNNLVIKSGHSWNHEAETLQFIAKHTTIPIPKETLNENEKESIADELCYYINQIRALKGDYIDALNRGKAIIGQISSLEGGGHVTAILDWEYAGCYPEYWDYILALRHLKPMPDWPDHLPRIFPRPYEVEYIGMSFSSWILKH
ncbi:hypothetical protein N7493_008516 [Penicillium malachiteum]|uniref:Aminoglycoside phosphotransferase domain-containing protein n=1 Tax=Penicillium malachiteum TaxID=1324776 RepID=A0AAD6MU13_9EURO|nr:hypothetical protein N7493_008516 [Penicillium malachiteum]